MKRLLTAIDVSLSTLLTLTASPVRSDGAAPGALHWVTQHPDVDRLQRELVLRAGRSAWQAGDDGRHEPDGTGESHHA
jgi:hypothetical protein